MILLCKIDLDLSCMRVYELRGCYLTLLQYLYPFLCVSLDVTDIFSKMKNDYLKLIQLVGEIVAFVPYIIGAPVCILFYLCPILRIVVIYV